MAPKTKTVLVCLTALALVLAGTLTVIAGGYTKPQKVVYHINSNNLMIIGGALRNIQNHINAVGADKLTIVVVVHSGGHFMFRKGKTTRAILAKIKSLKMQGVKFGLCAITLQRKKLTLKDMIGIKKAELIGSGVAELGRLQMLGFAYIKP
jgi:intracellular sulfur oxidation DsrE/DsrF family protein